MGEIGHIITIKKIITFYWSRNNKLDSNFDAKKWALSNIETKDRSKDRSRELHELWNNSPIGSYIAIKQQKNNNKPKIKCN